MCVARAGGRMAVCTLGNGVVPAGIQRVATRDAPRREPAAAQWTVRADGVDRIVRAAGIETAARPEQWTDQDLVAADEDDDRSEEHTSELQSLMRISYAVFCLKKKTKQINTNQRYTMQS